MIWGTTIDLHDAMSRTKLFLRDFAEVVDSDPLYPQLLLQAKEDNSYNLNIDAQHISRFDTEHGCHLYRDMVRYPQEMIPIFDLCVFEEFQRMFGEQEDQKRFQVRRPPARSAPGPGLHLGPNAARRRREAEVGERGGGRQQEGQRAG